MTVFRIHEQLMQLNRYEVLPLRVFEPFFDIMHRRGLLSKTGK
jgi:hypothetical protein